MTFRFWRKDRALALIAGLVFALSTTPAEAADKSTNNSTDKTSDNSVDTSLSSRPGYKCWSDATVKPTAAMLCIHGLGLHGGAYDEFGTRMSHTGAVVYAIDMHGFGAWMSKRDGDNLDFSASLDDIKGALKSIRTNHPGLPVFLLGESMGGAIVIKACAEFPELIDGLISSAPGGARYKEVREDLVVGLRVLTRPRKQFDIGKSIIDQATKDPTLRQLWLKDPLNRADLSAAQLIKFQLFMDGNDAAVRKIKTTPVLVLQGNLDRLVKPDDTWSIFRALTTERKTFIALRSEHLVIEYGRVKSVAYNTKTAELISSWMQKIMTPASEYDDLPPHSI